MLTVHLLGLQVNPGKVSMYCVSQSPVVKSLKQALCKELLSVPMSLLFSCALAQLSAPRMRRSQRFFKSSYGQMSWVFLFLEVGVVLMLGLPLCILGFTVLLQRGEHNQPFFQWHS